MKSTLKKDKMFTETNDIKKNNLKWKIAKTVLMKYGVISCTCDFCSKCETGFDCKVFHKVKGNSYLRELNDETFYLTDHIILCKKCKKYIPKGWFGCRCNSEDLLAVKSMLN